MAAALSRRAPPGARGREQDGRYDRASRLRPGLAPVRRRGRAAARPSLALATIVLSLVGGLIARSAAPALLPAWTVPLMILAALALAVIAARRPDAVLLDLRMPGGDGFLLKDAPHSALLDACTASRAASPSSLRGPSA